MLKFLISLNIFNLLNVKITRNNYRIKAIKISPGYKRLSKNLTILQAKLNEKSVGTFVTDHNSIKGETFVIPGCVSTRLCKRLSRNSVANLHYVRTEL